MSSEIRIHLLNREKPNTEWQFLTLKLSDNKYCFVNLDFSKNDDFLGKIINEINKNEIEFLPNGDESFFFINHNLKEDIFIFTGKGKKKYKVSKEKQYNLKLNQKFTFGKNIVCFINKSIREDVRKIDDREENLLNDEKEMSEDLSDEDSICVNTPLNSKKKEPLKSYNKIVKEKECGKESKPNTLNNKMDEIIKECIMKKDESSNSLKRKSSSTCNVSKRTPSISEYEKSIRMLKENDENDCEKEVSKSQEGLLIKTTTNPEQSNNTFQNKKIKQTEYKISISGFKLDSMEIKELTKIGLILVSDENFQLLILESFKRTKKVLKSICKGLPILTKEWLNFCLIQKKILDIDKFYYKNQSIEMEFNFDFRKSIEIARENHEEGFLMHEKFWIPKDNKFFKEFIDIINCAGGIIIESKEPDKECIILLGNEQDFLIKEFKKKKLKIYSNELLLVGCLRQKLDFKEFELNEEGILNKTIKDY